MTILHKIRKKFTHAIKVSSYLKQLDVHELVQFGGKLPRVIRVVVGYVAYIQGKKIA
jgi:hypothetical protein